MLGALLESAPLIKEHMNFHIETYIQLCINNPDPCAELEEKINRLARLIKVVYHYTKSDLELFVAEAVAIKDQLT